MNPKALIRLDVVTVFPDYLAPLDLSLIGRARAAGMIDLAVHDLRQVTTDRHRTVDDTPYGGGAGMVMTPEPWARSLEAVIEAGHRAGRRGRPRLIVPTPSGRVFSQAMAGDLAAEPWLVFACGRYEGIDERVVDWADDRFTVTPLSIGDYVLFGGEVAVLVVCEAVIRLLPGVLGNPDSVLEESHADGLLEYPVYTKPATWRGREVPPVLLTGDHAAIRAWRADEQRRRTGERRPDLLGDPARLRAEAGRLLVDGGEAGGGHVEVRAAVAADAGELLTVQRACWLTEARDNPQVRVPATHETLEEVRRGLSEWVTVVVRAGGRLIASARGRRDGSVWEIGRLMVVPDLQGHGLGRWLLATMEDWAPDDVNKFRLYTGATSIANQRMYKRAGYRPIDGEPIPGAVLLGRERRR